MDLAGKGRWTLLERGDGPCEEPAGVRSLQGVPPSGGDPPVGVERLTVLLNSVLLNRW